MREVMQLYTIVFPALVKCRPIGIARASRPEVQAATSERGTQFAKYSLSLERATHELSPEVARIKGGKWRMLPACDYSSHGKPGRLASWKLAPC